MNESNTLTIVHTAANNVWAAVLQAVEKLRATAVRMPSPDILYEQLRILLRDESKQLFSRFVPDILINVSFIQFARIMCSS